MDVCEGKAEIQDIKDAHRSSDSRSPTHFCPKSPNHHRNSMFCVHKTDDQIPTGPTTNIHKQSTWSHTRMSNPNAFTQHRSTTYLPPTRLWNKLDIH